jgi:hypothetical protein
MSNFNRPSPLILPSQLEDGRDDTINAIHTAWADKTTHEIRAAMPESHISGTGDASIRYAELVPLSGDDYDPDNTAIMALPVAKTWEPATYAWSEIVRQIAIPDGRLIVLPNNNIGQKAYTFTDKERGIVAKGNLAPLSERHLRLCEELGIDAVSLVIGRSFGASAGAAFGNHASDYIQLNAHAFDEAPNTIRNRSMLALSRSLVHEKSQTEPVTQQVGLPAFTELTAGDAKLQSKLRLARYTLGLRFARSNPSINRMFQHDTFFDDVAGLVSGSPTATVSLSNANSSTVGDGDATAALAAHLGGYPNDEIAQHLFYDGYHLTAGNPFVMGLLARRALDWHNNGVQIAGRDIGSLGQTPETVETARSEE